MGWSSIKKMLMRLARKVLEGVLGKLDVQKRLIQEIMDRINSFFPILRDVWEGDDSLKFIERVEKRSIPKVAQLIAAVGGIHSSITRSMEIMDSADAKNAAAVQNVRDAFSKIKL